MRNRVLATLSVVLFLGTVCSATAVAKSANLKHTIGAGPKCTIIAKPRQAVVVGTNKRDIICGRAETKRILGKGGNDIIRSFPSTKVDAGRGRDRVEFSKQPRRLRLSLKNGKVIARGLRTGTSSNSGSAQDNSQCPTRERHTSQGQTATSPRDPSTTTGAPPLPDGAPIILGDGDDLVLVGPELGRIPFIQTGGGNDMVWVAAASEVRFLEMGAGDDVVHALTSIAHINSGEGNDTIKFHCASFVEAGAGSDTVIGTAAMLLDTDSDRFSGPNTLHGDDKVSLTWGSSIQTGKGNDSVRVEDVGAVDLGEGDDTLSVTSSAAWVECGAGDDIVNANSAYIIWAFADDGDDRLDALEVMSMYGGSGADRLTAKTSGTIFGDGLLANPRVSDGPGHDQDIIHSDTAGSIDGGGGNDTITAPVAGELSGGGGNDILDSRTTGTLDGGDGNDTIHSGEASRIIGGDGDDTIHSDRSSYIYGDAGADTIYGGHASSLQLGDGSDQATMTGDVAWLGGDESVESGSSAGEDVVRIHGELSHGSLGSGRDSLTVIGMISSADLGDGDDYLEVGGEASWINGGEGKDVIRLGGSSSHINGDQGNDTIWGSNFDDSLTGGAGDDRLYGKGGNDQLIGGDSWNLDAVQNDFFDGGDGEDMCGPAFGDLAAC